MTGLPTPLNCAPQVTYPEQLVGHMHHNTHTPSNSRPDELFGEGTWLQRITEAMVHLTRNSTALKRIAELRVHLPCPKCSWHCSCLALVNLQSAWGSSEYQSVVVVWLVMRFDPALQAMHLATIC